ncbi:MAG: hypothetical protein IT381_02580 [Deltaproteobacteria bacterium]|nr:hypothetical protein [Deltaproteobacteria bacterium]
MQNENNAIIAGVVHASCFCCADSKLLLNHLQLGSARMYCPATQQTYLDRGDGVFRPDGAKLAATALAPTPTALAATDLLDDRPARTSDKTRINLERATFA